METISIRRGESLTLEIEADDPLATQVTLNVGKLGESPVISVSTSFQMVDEKLVALIRVEPNQTEVPSGEYKYQLTVQTGNNDVEKYPDTDDCDDCDEDLPLFVVKPALDSPEA